MAAIITCDSNEILEPNNCYYLYFIGRKSERVRAKLKTMFNNEENSEKIRVFLDKKLHSSDQMLFFLTFLHQYNEKIIGEKLIQSVLESRSISSIKIVLKILENCTENEQKLRKRDEILQKVLESSQCMAPVKMRIEKMIGKKKDFEKSQRKKSADIKMEISAKSRDTLVQLYVRDPCNFRNFENFKKMSHFGKRTVLKLLTSAEIDLEPYENEPVGELAHLIK